MDKGFVPPLPTVFGNIRQRITTMISSIDLYTLHCLWEVISYILDVVRAAKAGHIDLLVTDEIKLDYE